MSCKVNYYCLMIGITCQRCLIETYDKDLVMFSPNCQHIYFLAVYVNKYNTPPTPPPILLLISDLAQKSSSLDKCFGKVIFSQYIKLNCTLVKLEVESWGYRRSKSHLCWVTPHPTPHIHPRTRVFTPPLVCHSLTWGKPL